VERLALALSGDAYGGRGRCPRGLGERLGDADTRVYADVGVKKLPRWVLIVSAIVLVAVLAAVLVAVFGGKSSTTTTTTSGTTTTASDPAVAELQQTMTRLGYYSGPIDGVYGPATTAAVKEMQKALGVNADGVYGPATSHALKSKGNDVTVQIQTELAKYGYYSGPIDGDYGSTTTDAVKKLQTDLGVPADGLVGAGTIDAFNKAVADGTLQPTTSTTPTTTTSTTTTSTTPSTTTTATTGTTTTGTATTGTTATSATTT
jgi:peptidoglycan hydrolase-like protein with peptidoglycan-binding domain